MMEKRKKSKDEEDGEDEGKQEKNTRYEEETIKTTGSTSRDRPDRQHTSCMVLSCMVYPTLPPQPWLQGRRPVVVETDVDIGSCNTSMSMRTVFCTWRLVARPKATHHQQADEEPHLLRRSNDASRSLDKCGRCRLCPIVGLPPLLPTMVHWRLNTLTTMGIEIILRMEYISTLI